MIVAEYIVSACKIYAAIGGVVAAAFLLYGIDRVDQGAHATYAFRPLLIPGAVLLWPLVVWRWIALERRHS